MRLRKLPKNEKILRPIHPNLGIEAAYRRCLYAIIEEMHDSTIFWLRASYRQNTPRIAIDAWSDNSTPFARQVPFLDENPFFDAEAIGLTRDLETGPEDFSALPVVKVPLVSLRSAQPEVNSQEVELLSSFDFQVMPPIDVVRVEGVLVIREGNHRAVAALQTGIENVRVRILECKHARGGQCMSLAQDESPADALRRVIKRLVRRWLRRFDRMATQLAAYFTQSIASRSTAQLKKILKDAGWTVEFKMTAAMRDVVDAAVHANVQLIKSIPQQYLGQVEQIVMQSVQAGRDLEYVSDELQGRLGVTKRRAALIARDQNNKVSAAISRARQIEIGIEQAVWVHSGAGKEPRPSHVKAGRDRVRYNVRDGWLDPHEGRNILPGELISCRCVGRAVVPGFS